jgi:Neprosin
MVTTLLPLAYPMEASARWSSAGRALLLMLDVLCLAGCNEHPRPGANGLPRWWLEGSDQTEPPEPPGRQAEVDAYNAKLYAAQGFELLDTTVTQDGQSIDWVADGSMAGFYATPPPKSKDIPLPKNTVRQRTELDEHPELVGPAGTIPVYRNRFERYVSGESGASSLQDYLDHDQVMGRTDGENRLYAGLRADTPNKGAVGWVNAFEGDVEADTFSLIEMAVFCEGANKPQTLEQIGIVASRDRANFKNGLLRLRIEFFTAGPGQLGPNKGGWDQGQLGFQAAAGRRYSPGAHLRGSTPGGPQEEARFEIRLFQGRWWVGYNADWLGSYDASLFPLMKTGACGAAWYGEVYDRTPIHWTTTGMGSGQFPDKGYGNVSWVSNPALFKDASGFWSSPTDAIMGPMDSACYTRTPLAPRGPGLPPWFFLGGPGGRAAACK